MATPHWRQALACLLPALLAGWASSTSAVHAQTIATGARHGLVLTADGSVLAWGDNRQGQLGQRRTAYSDADRVIPLPVKAVSLKTSATHALVLDEEGNVWSWGTNRKGQLGDGTLADRATPQVIFRNAAQITDNGGDLYPSTLIDREGQPWWWGPLPSGTVQAQPLQSAAIPGRLTALMQEGSTSAGLDEQGVVWAWGEGVACTGSPALSGPVAMRGVPPIRRFRLTDQTYGNMYGRNPPHSLVYAQDRDGRYWKWGSEFVTGGFEGLWPQWKDFCPPTESADAQRLMEATYTGPDELRNLGVVLSYVDQARSKTIDVSQQAFYYGWTQGGDLWLWTYQDDSHTKYNVAQVASGVVEAGAYSSGPDAYLPGLMFITRDGRLHVRGTNARLHHGVADGDLDSTSSPRKVVLPGPAASVHTQSDGSYALLRDGRVFRWGSGDLRYGSEDRIRWPAMLPTPALVDAPVPFVKLAADSGLWMGLDASGNVWSTTPVEQGATAQDLRPAMVPRTTGLPAVRDIAARGGLLLGVDATVWSRGAWTKASAGAPKAFVPTQVSGLPSTIAQVAGTRVGGFFALDASGSVWYWGFHGFGLGGRDTTQEHLLSPAVKAPFVLPLPDKAISIHTGDYNFCAVLDDGAAFCRGRMFNGHLGRLFRLHAPVREVSISVDGEREGTAHFRLIDGTVWAWGKGQGGQLGSGTYTNAVQPVPVLSETGTADLDLDPAAPNVAAPKHPPFRVKTRLAGNLRSLSFGGDVFGSAGTPAGSNVYAMAGGAPAGGGTWLQRDAQGQWGPLGWPVPAVASGVQLASEAQSVPLAHILQQFPGSGLAGLHVYVGYGRDVDEMLAAGRYREVLELAPEY